MITIDPWALLANLAIALITARVTVFYSLKRFHSERWWERKASAYASIMESLHHVRNHADHHLVFLQRSMDMPEESNEELTSKLRNAMAELRKHWDVGGFVISSRALSVMTTFMKEVDEATEPDTWSTHLILKLEAVDKCLKQMRIAAREDLKLG
jgi:hypothetical protein